MGGFFVEFEAIRCSAQVTSLEVRGKQPEEMTKLMLCDLLHRDIMLEKRVLGERAHRRIHELEEEIRELKKVRRVALAKRLVVDITKMWAPLREIQAEEDARDRQKKQTEVVENIALTRRPFPNVSELQLRVDGVERDVMPRQRRRCGRERVYASRE